MEIKFQKLEIKNETSMGPGSTPFKNSPPEVPEMLPSVIVLMLPFGTPWTRERDERETEKGVSVRSRSEKIASVARDENKPVAPNKQYTAQSVSLSLSLSFSIGIGRTWMAPEHAWSHITESALEVRRVLEAALEVLSSCPHSNLLRNSKSLLIS
jgi:hypothetical protein